MYHVKIVIVIDWYSCFFFFSCDLNFLYGFEISWRSSFMGLQFRDFFFFFFFFTIQPRPQGAFPWLSCSQSWKTRNRRPANSNSEGKRKKVRVICDQAFFFSGLLVIVLQYSSRIPVACPQTPRTPRAQGSLSRFALALALMFSKRTNRKTRQRLCTGYFAKIC